MSDRPRPSELIVDANFEAIRQIESWLAASVAVLGFDPNHDAMASIHLAIHEVAANAVDHATGHGDKLRFTAHRATVENQSALVIEVRDNGSQTFDPFAVVAPTAGQPQVRGYGLMIAEQVASELTYQRCAGSDADAHPDAETSTKTNTIAWTNRWQLRFEMP